MAYDPNIRASDADRDRAASLLREHHAAGRLTAEEFGERLDRAFGARTVGEIDNLLKDLPGIDLYRLPDAALTRQPRQRQRRRPSSGRGSQAWPTTALGLLVHRQPGLLCDLGVDQRPRLYLAPVGGCTLGRGPGWKLGDSPRSPGCNRPVVGLVAIRADHSCRAAMRTCRAGAGAEPPGAVRLGAALPEYSGFDPGYTQRSTGFRAGFALSADLK